MTKKQKSETVRWAGSEMGSQMVRSVDSETEKRPDSEMARWGDNKEIVSLADNEMVMRL